jgi:hypothetical protein
MNADMYFAMSADQKRCVGMSEMRRCKSTEVRSNLEFNIGTLWAGALQWREDHV